MGASRGARTSGKQTEEALAALGSGRQQPEMYGI